MKKLIVTLSGLLLVVSIFSGCQNTSVPDAEELKQISSNQEKRIGIMQSLGSIETSMSATHLLRMEDGNILYLKSDALDLSNEKYIDSEVEVMGKIIRTTNGDQVMDVSSIDLLDTEVTEVESFPIWLDYSSDELLISFKYRDDYILDYDGTTINIVKKPDNEIGEIEETNEILAVMSISMEANDETKLLGYLGVNSLSGGDLLAGNVANSKVTQRAIDAFKKSDSNGNMIYYVPVGDNLYVLKYYNDDESNKVDEKNMFYDIMASIDFKGGMKNSDQDNDDEFLDNRSNEAKDDQAITDENAANVDDEVVEVSIEDEKVNVGATVSTESIVPSGYSLFESEKSAIKFYYPKSYYFSATNAEAGAYRTFEFGGSPLEETAGDVFLSEINSVPASASSSQVNGTMVYTEKVGGNVTYYINKNGKTYKVSGPSEKEAIVKNITLSIDSPN